MGSAEYPRADDRVRVPGVTKKRLGRVYPRAYHWRTAQGPVLERLPVGVTRTAELPAVGSVSA